MAKRSRNDASGSLRPAAPLGPIDHRSPSQVVTVRHASVSGSRWSMWPTPDSSTTRRGHLPPPRSGRSAARSRGARRRRRRRARAAGERPAAAARSARPGRSAAGTGGRAADEPLGGGAREPQPGHLTEISETRLGDRAGEPDGRCGAGRTGGKAATGGRPQGGLAPAEWPMATTRVRSNGSSSLPRWSMPGATSSSVPATRPGCASRAGDTRDSRPPSHDRQGRPQGSSSRRS